MSWYTQYEWMPDSGLANQVLSYSNVWTEYTEASMLVRIASIKSHVQAAYAGQSVIANVAYDIFVTKLGSETIEVMVQLGAFNGAKPISMGGSAIATVSIGRREWNLYKGRNDYAKSDVYSFVAVDATHAIDIDETLDLKLFLHYLMLHDGITGDYHLVSIGFGTEVFRGKGVFYVKDFTLDVLYK